MKGALCGKGTTHPGNKSNRDKRQKKTRQKKTLINTSTNTRHSITTTTTTTRSKLSTPLTQLQSNATVIPPHMNQHRGITTAPSSLLISNHHTQTLTQNQSQLHQNVTTTIWTKQYFTTNVQKSSILNNNNALQQSTPSLSFNQSPSLLPSSLSSSHNPTMLTGSTITTNILGQKRRKFSSNINKPGEHGFTPQQMNKFQDLIDKEAQHVDNFFDVDPNEESDGPMTEPEDLASYTREFDQDNIKPELFNPETQTMEYMIATLLQGEIDKGIPMFPVYLRGPLFRKIVTTLERIMRTGNELDEQIITQVITDVFTNYAPEICKTHEHALNILFPMAPRLGDVVQLPNIAGHCIVSKREYLDNRDGFDDNTFENMNKNDDEDIGRFMVVTYECLHPTLRGKSFVSRHPFDLQVYGFAMQQNEKGLEQLMHERGMIDMYTGRIINPLEHASKIPGLTGAGSKPLMIQQRGNDEKNAKNGIVSSKLLARPPPLQHRPDEISAGPGETLQLPGPGDLARDPKQQQQLQQQQQVLQLPGEGVTTKITPAHTLTPSELAALTPDEAKQELIKRQQYTITTSDPTTVIDKDQKHYYQQLVLSGDKAAFMYRQLVQELTQGKSRFDSKPATAYNDANRTNTIAVVEQQAKGKVTLADIRNHGALNARLTNKGAMYGPDAFADFGAESNIPIAKLNEHDNNNNNNNNHYLHAMGTSHISTSPAVPNQPMTIRQQQELDKDIEAGLDEVVGASSHSSKYYQQYKEMKKIQREEMRKSMENDTGVKLYSDIVEEKRQQLSKIETMQAKFNALVQYHVDQGKTVEEAQVLADNQFDPETGEIRAEGSGDLADDDDNSGGGGDGTSEPNITEDLAKQQYINLPQHYKAKYKHILIKDGPGAGLPDPLAIEFGEDLFEIYPNANIALMDFLSDQWSLMVKEKQEEQQMQHAQQIQREDDAIERAKRQQNGIVDDDEDEEAPRRRFVEDTNEHNVNRMEIPKDVEATRYRLLAAVAAAGHHAFTADYVTELFDRVSRYEKDRDAEIADRYIPMIKNNNHNNSVKGGEHKNNNNNNRNINHVDIENEPDFIYNFEQQKFKRQKTKQDQIDEENRKQAELNRDNNLAEAEIVPEYTPPTTDTSVSLTPEGYVKFGGKLLTQMEYAEQIFGKKPIPIEQTNVVPNRMKQMITDHYRYRDSMSQQKKVNTATEALRGQSKRKFWSSTLNNYSETTAISRHNNHINSLDIIQLIKH